LQGLVLLRAALSTLERGRQNFVAFGGQARGGLLVSHESWLPSIDLLDFQLWIDIFSEIIGNF
jgi:hypothetical protein